jgi:hypothetical protein
MAGIWPARILNPLCYKNLTIVDSVKGSIMHNLAF